MGRAFLLGGWGGGGLHLNPWPLCVITMVWTAGIRALDDEAFDSHQATARNAMLDCNA